MDKRLIYPSNVGDTRDTYFVKEDRVYLRKHASEYHPEISAYIEKATPIENLVQVLLTALGAYEFWGQNVNGDRFRVPSLMNAGPDYGYKTFETNANYFLHHVNKDPALSKGRVLKAVWNDKAKRVELVVGIDVNLDPEGVAMIDRGENLTFSMGAKVPYDVCSICANRAKTRAEYCDHLKYQMNQIDPVTGMLVGADNTLPKFFDISRVLIPADKTAYMWTKIAGPAGNPFMGLSAAQLAELPPGKIADLSYLTKRAEEQRELAAEKLGASTKTAVSVKNAAIKKRIELKMAPDLATRLETTIPVAKDALQARSPSIPRGAIDRIHSQGAGLKEVLSTYAALGMEPKQDEMERLVSRYRPKAEMLAEYVPSSESVSEKVAAELIPYFEKRSFYRPVLLRRIVELSNGLDTGTHKIAQDLRGVNRSVSEGHAIKPAYVAGLVAALYTLFRSHLTEPRSGLSQLVSKFPIITIPLAVGAGVTLNSLFGSDEKKLPATGFYSVDANLDGLYNRPWQSRFADLQARPVTVIKTGAAKTYDTELAKKMFIGIPSLYVASHLAKAKAEANPHSQPGIISKTLADHPDVLSAGLIAEHVAGRPVSKRVGAVVNSAKRLFKTASINDLAFLAAVPETERELIWDLAILNAGDRIYRKLSGG